MTEGFVFARSKASAWACKAGYGDLIANTVILSNAKDLFTNNQILRNRGSE